MKCHVSIYAIRMPILCFEHNRQRQRENQQSIEFSNFESHGAVGKLEMF